nr:MAG TPA: hypothetical protein [Caudoviricetes sp.]
MSSLCQVLHSYGSEEFGIKKNGQNYQKHTQADRFYRLQAR